MFEKIVVAFDGSEVSKRSLEVAFGLVSPNGQVVAVNVFASNVHFLGEGSLLPDERWDTALEESRKASVDLLAGIKIGDAGRFKVVAEMAQSPWEGILAVVEREGGDMIIMGSSKKGLLARIFEGSETERVLSHSSVPLLVVK